jgi:hypothetical protein
MLQGCDDFADCMVLRRMRLDHGCKEFMGLIGLTGSPKTGSRTQTAAQGQVQLATLLLVVSQHQLQMASR